MKALLAEYLTPVMLWLLKRRFMNTEILAVRSDGTWGPVYVKGVTFRPAEGGIKFFLRCYETPHPVLTAGRPIPVRVLDYQEIARSSTGVWFHQKRNP
jgi:hypothetical protein